MGPPARGRRRGPRYGPCRNGADSVERRPVPERALAARLLDVACRRLRSHAGQSGVAGTPLDLSSTAERHPDPDSRRLHRLLCGPESPADSVSSRGDRRSRVRQPAARPCPRRHDRRREHLGATTRCRLLGLHRRSGDRHFRAGESSGGDSLDGCRRNLHSARSTVVPRPGEGHWSRPGATGRGSSAAGVPAAPEHAGMGRDIPDERGRVGLTWSRILDPGEYPQVSLTDSNARRSRTRRPHWPGVFCWRQAGSSWWVADYWRISETPASTKRLPRQPYWPFAWPPQVFPQHLALSFCSFTSGRVR